jgi:3-oxoacyl-[acyl-carrier protein] reductase
MSGDDTKKILDTNLHSAITGSRLAIKSMMKKKVHGCIINVSSLLATKGSSGTAVYAASKAGLLGEIQDLLL